jgi:hypothetical protein
MRTVTILMSLAIIPALVPGAEDKDTAPPKGWKDFSPKDKSFSVWLPDKGGRSSERERTLIVRGQRIKFNLIQLEANKGPTYSAASVLLPLQLTRKIPATERIEIFRDVFVEEVKGRIEQEKDIKQGRVSGKEYEIVTGQGVAKLRLYAMGGRVYKAMVFGSKEDVESENAKTFLESYKLPTRATDPAAAKTSETKPGDKPESKPAKTKPEDKLEGKAAKLIPGEMFAYLKSSVEEQRLADVDITGFKLAKEEYRDVPTDGGILLGFQVGLGKLATNQFVNAIRPIYRTKSGEKMGKWHGPEPAKPVTVKAKPGYVVGSVTIRTGLGIDGFSLDFVKVEKDHVEKEGGYTSAWIGGQGGNRTTIGGQGYIFVGICGHLNDRGNACSLGLVTVLLAKE